MRNIDLTHTELNYQEAAFVRKVLSGPLRFGDPDQIKAVKMLAPVELPEGLRRFKVTVTYSGGYTEVVDAEDKTKAIAEALEYLGDISEDCEVDTECVEVMA